MTAAEVSGMPGTTGRGPASVYRCPGAVAQVFRADDVRCSGPDSGDTDARAPVAGRRHRAARAARAADDRRADSDRHLRARGAMRSRRTRSCERSSCRRSPTASHGMRRRSAARSSITPATLIALIGDVVALGRAGRISPRGARQPPLRARAHSGAADGHRDARPARGHRWRCSTSPGAEARSG